MIKPPPEERHERHETKERNMPVKSTALLSIFLLFSLTVVGAAGEDKETLVKVGGRAPAFSIQTLDGETLAPDALKGKVVLINFFATWCWPCMIEMPQLQRQVYTQYKDNPGFVMVS